MNAATRILVLLCLVSGPAASIWAMEPQPSPDLIAGIESYNAGRITVAITHLQAAAGRGEAEAMVNLGYIYARGQAGMPTRTGHSPSTGRLQRSVMVRR